MTEAIIVVAVFQAILTIIAHKFISSWLNSALVGAFVQLGITITMAITFTLLI